MFWIEAWFLETHFCAQIHQYLKINCRKFRNLNQRIFLAWHLGKLCAFTMLNKMTYKSNTIRILINNIIKLGSTSYIISNCTTIIHQPKYQKADFSLM